jgi:parvulin-like peptidyl-prolyl isomerase
MKLKLFLSAVLILGLVSAQAATENAAAPAAPAAASDTNATATDAMTALFGDPVVAKGKGFEIKRSELDQVVTAAKANASAAGQSLPSGFEMQILNQLIYIQVLQQLATDADRAEGKQEAQIQFTNIIKHFGSEEAFQRQLKAVNMTVDQLLNKAIAEATAKAALRRQLNVNITDVEAMDYYTNHPSDFEQPELVHARHLLLLTIDPSTHQPLPADQIAAKRKQIDDLRKRLVAGEDFSTLAKQYSEDPGSKDEGGELSPFPREKMVAPFSNVAFSLPTNQISEVVTTEYGFHLIKVLDKTPAKTLDFSTVSDDLKKMLAQQKMAKLAPPYIQKLKKTYDVEIVDPGLKTMADAMDAADTNSPASTPDK